MKKVISFMLVLVMLFVAAGCKSNKNPEASSGSSEVVASSQSSDDSTDSSKVTSTNSSASTSTITSTVTSVVASGKVKVETCLKDEQEKETPIKPEFTLDGDTTVRDELKFGKYKLVWSDEFNGTGIDWSIWQESRPETRVADIKYDINQMKFNGKTMLNISERYFDPDDSTKKFIEGINIETKKSMNYQYGYLELRARLPYTQGTWPGFWNMTDTINSLAKDINRTIGNFDVEIDIYEIFGSYDTATPNIHKWGSKHTQFPGSLKNRYRFEDITHLRDEFHVYGYLWTEDEISMYVDGEKYQTFDLNYNYDGDPTTGMDGFHRWQYIIINASNIHSPLNTGIDNTDMKADNGSIPSDFPFESEFDWIRLYQIPGTGGIMTAE